MPRKELHKFQIELQQDSAERIKEILSKDTVELHDYTYKIKTREIADNKSRYVLSPVALSAGYRNCFLPIVEFEIFDNNDTTVNVTLKAHLAVRIMLAVLCTVFFSLELVMWSVVLFNRIHLTLEEVYVNIVPLIIPSVMLIVYFVTFRNVRNALLEEIGKINV